MAVDFGILAQTPTIGARYAEGLQAAQAERDRNMLRQQQAAQIAMQQENMLAQREERASLTAQRQTQEARAAQRQQFLTGAAEALAQGGATLDRPTLMKVLKSGVQANEPTLIQFAREGLKALDEEDLYQREVGRLGLPGAAAPANAMAAPAGITRDTVQNMMMSPSGRIREQGKALAPTLPTVPKEAEPTSGMREYQEAVRQGFKGTFMEYKQALQPKPAQVSVKLPAQEGAFETGLGKAQAERVMDDQKVAQDARGIIDTVQQGRQLLQSGAITGFGAEALTQIGAALNQMGINFAEDKVANTQAFAANMAQNVGRIIKQFGAGTGLSNADREYAEKMAGGKITLDRKAIERILDINERAARNAIRAHNTRVQGIKTNVPLAVDEPAGAPAAAVIPAGPPAAKVDVSTERANARAAIAAGAPEAAVRKRFKDKTGQEF